MIIVSNRGGLFLWIVVKSLYFAVLLKSDLQGILIIQSTRNLTDYYRGLKPETRNVVLHGYTSTIIYHLYTEASPLQTTLWGFGTCFLLVSHSQSFE